MPGSADKKKAAIRSFDPSFTGSTVEPFESLFQIAYTTSTDEAANKNIFKLIDQNAGGGAQYSFESSVSGQAGWFEFGHPSTGGDNLSLFAPFKLFFEFENDDQLKSVRLTLFILNARFIFSERGYSPATIAANLRYTLEGGSGQIGLVISRVTSSDGSADRQKIFEELTASLPAGALDPLGGPWRAFDKDTLLGGLVIEMAWRAVNRKFPKSSRGKAKNKVLASMLGGTGSDQLSLFAPGLKAEFNGLVHESERFGLNLEPKQLGNVEAVLVLGEHSGIKGADATKLKSSLREFGLKSDFRGILFTNIGAHWLDDGALGVNIIATQASLAAIAFQEKETSARSAKIYFTFAGELDPTNNESYLKLLKKGAVLNLTLVV